MRLNCVRRGAFVATLCMTICTNAVGAVYINEFVKEERTAGGNTVANDSREFVELYNDANSPVLIENWSLVTFDPAAGSPGN